MMENRIVTAVFKGSKNTKVSDVWQWDYGQVLRIQGLDLPTAVEVDFAVAGASESIARIGTTKDGVTDVVIPDSLIETGKNLVAYIYLRDSASGNTEYQIDMLVTKRAKPEAYDRPEDKELFGQAIEAVNTAADRAEKAGQAAQEAAQKAGLDAEQTAQDRAEVAKMVETVSDISEQVKKVEELSNKAQESATQAGTSATAAEKAKAQAETAAGKTAEDRTAVNQAKIAVDEAQKAVRADRAAVEEAKQSVEQLSNAIPESTQVGVQAVNQAKQTAVDEIARTGTSHKTAVEGAGTQAVESVENVQQVATEAVETAKTEAVQAVQAEGAKQIKEVQDKGAEVLQSIPEDFATQMETKLNKQQGIENKGKVLVIEEDGNVVPGEVASGGGDGIAIINTMSGESPLVIPDSAERVNKRLELGGKTEQAQTSGKNLANPSEFVIGTLAGDTGNIINLKQYIATGYIPVIPGKRYSTSCGNKFLVHTITAYDKEKKKINSLINMSSEMPEGAAYIRLSYKKIDMTNVTESDMEELKKVCMLNEGSKSISYEPYTGGKPSPSPEYPQEIKNAGKWNEETQKYEVEISISGRNLFDFSTCEEGKIFEGGGNIASSANGLLTDFIPCFPNSQYSRSRTGFTVVAFYDCNKNKIGFELVGDSTFITPQKCRYFRYSINKAQVDYEKLVACPGNTVMEYEPYYHKPIFLTLTSDRPITKWDRLVEQGGQIGWLYAGVVIDRFDGQSNKISIANKQGNVQNFSIRFENVANGNGNSDIFVDKYRAVQLSYTKAEYGICCNWNDGAKYFSAPNENVATVDEFKAWLIENPLKIAYETTNPEFIPLPQSEQNAIRALKTYYPTTVITADGGELDPDIKVTYTADTKNYIDNKVSAKVASIIRQYRLNTANLLSLMPMETQAAMIENDTNNILNNLESEETQ